MVIERHHRDGTTDAETVSAGLPEEGEQAERFRRARLARQSEVAEDYVELIADLLDASGEARLVDIARRLGVSHATVVNTLARLQRDALIHSQPYRGIFLTEAGRELATTVRQRHRLVVDFLRALGVDSRIAEIDAEGLEHHLSAETLEAFRRFLDRPDRD